MNPFSFSRLFFLGIFLITPLLLVANERKSVRVLTYNAWYGFTKKADRKPEWLRYVRSLQSDIVALQELNGYTEEKLAEDGKFWGHKFTALLKKDGFPTGITSRYPIENLSRVTEGYHHGMLSCKTGGIQVYVIHLHPGHWEIRHQEIDLLLKTLASHQLNEPVLLIGDFNTFSARDQAHYQQSPDMIPFFRRLDIRWKSNRNLRNDRLDYSHLQKIERAGYQDVIAERRERFLGTFPTKLRLDEDNGPSRRLDYIFANKVLAEKCIKAQYLINSKTDLLSDHYPAIAEFEIE
jgi:endonuclease/exonuclease/phosphatase family metal-dependent hydrolase